MPVFIDFGNGDCASAIRADPVRNVFHTILWDEMGWDGIREPPNSSGPE